MVNLDLTNFRQNNQNVRYIVGWLIAAASFFYFLSFLFRCDVSLPSFLGSERLV